MKNKDKIMFKSTTFKEMLSYDDTSIILNGLVRDNLSYDLLVCYLYRTSLIKAYKGSLCIGFLSIEDKENDSHSVEIHAYIFPKHRRYFKQCVKDLSSYIFENSEYNEIYTTVFSDYSHVVRFLHILGFNIIDTLLDVDTKNGKSINSTEMKLKR